MKFTFIRRIDSALFEGFDKNAEPLGGSKQELLQKGVCYFSASHVKYFSFGVEELYTQNVCIYGERERAFTCVYVINLHILLIFLFTFWIFACPPILLRFRVKQQCK